MADDLPSKPFGNNDDEENSDSVPTSHLQLDLGIESNRLGNSKARVSAPASSSSCDNQRREDNPFSFKHFLQSDSTNSYQGKGARPKVYENRSSSADFENHLPETKPPRLIPEYPSALPDFVQDHLVIEQCYLGNSTANSYNLEIDNLPDCTPGRPIINNVNTENTSKRPVPLDLPRRNQDAFPLDLPISTSNIANSNNGMALSEVGNSKSLPDFLADSAVCAQKSDTLSVTHSPEGEFERLRNELDITTRQLSEKSRLCDSLSRELEVARNKEHEYTQNLARALEKLENNLENSRGRAASAESLVYKLKQEIKSLNVQLNAVKAENHILRGEEASGGHNYYNSPDQLQYLRFAQELRAAASTAEVSLRQLLTGVDNLRIMAASIENMHRIEETRDPFSNFDDDAGPAL